MKKFHIKQLTHEETPAELLAQARTRKGVTIEEVSHILNIQPHYLQALEDGHLDALPGKLYAQKYLERYCRYLEVPLDTLSPPLERVFNEGVWAHAPRPIGVTPAHLVVWPARLRVMAVAVILIGIAGYFAFALVARLTPPPLALAYPYDGLVIHAASVTVSGAAVPEARLTVNGTAVPVDAQGRFAISLSLNDGINYIRLTAARRAGKERVVDVKVIKE